MSLRKFGENDLIYNTLKAHPKNHFVVTDSRIFYNHSPQQSGAFTSNLLVGHSQNLVGLISLAGAPTLAWPGFISLYEYNIDKNDGHTGMTKNPYIYPFITKDSARASFKSAGKITGSKYDTEFNYGDVLTASYPQWASITRDFAPVNATTSVDGPYDWNANMFYSLKNLYNLYGTLSQHYMVTSSYGDKTKQQLNLISIPSIFYGEKINPGSVSLKWYFTGSLIGELRDEKQNGELIQVGPPGSEGSGSIAGVVFYNEGFLSLTGSWSLSTTKLGLQNRGTSSWSPADGLVDPSWLYFGAGAQDSINKGAASPAVNFAAANLVSASFGLTFEGTTKTQVITMYAHARRGQANYSNNPTFLKYGQEQLEYTSSHVYEENSNRLIANTVSSSFTGASASFKRQTYITKVAIYDENKDLLGIATLANPVRKQEDEDLAFKIKLDI